MTAFEDMIEIESAKERFMGNCELYKKLLYQFAEGTLFRELEKELNAGDAEAAFDAAHTMKGVAANLSLRQLLEPLTSIVETLRSRKLPDGQEMQRLREVYEQNMQWISEMKEGSRKFKDWKHETD